MEIYILDTPYPRPNRSSEAIVVRNRCRTPLPFYSEYRLSMVSMAIKFRTLVS